MYIIIYLIQFEFYRRNFILKKYFHNFSALDYQMPEISVTLVRKHNIAKDADELLGLEIICLDDLGIEEIDNLEVFDKIKELRLSSNKIKIIENLEFLFHLLKLDVSYNQITLAELESGLKKLPRSVIFIDVSGNPCTEDSTALQSLQDRYTNIEIFCNGTRVINASRPGTAHRIVDASESVPSGAAPARSMSKRGASLPSQPRQVEVLPTPATDIALAPPTSESEDVTSTRFQRLDADAVVREIVERKCRRQDVERELVELTLTADSAGSTGGEEEGSGRDRGPENDEDGPENDEDGEKKNLIVANITAEADTLRMRVDEEMARGRLEREGAVLRRLQALDAAAEQRQKRHDARMSSVPVGNNNGATGTGSADAEGNGGAGDAKKTSADESVDVFMQRLRRRAVELRAQLQQPATGGEDSTE